jgi:hypothetical protein
MPPSDQPYCNSQNYTVVKHCCNVSTGHFLQEFGTCVLNETLWDSFYKCSNETITPELNQTAECVAGSAEMRARIKWGLLGLLGAFAVGVVCW